MKYEVLVGNVGSVHTGNNPVEANKHYKEYVRQSKSHVGRAGHEWVAVMRDGNLFNEYFCGCKECKEVQAEDDFREEDQD